MHPGLIPPTVTFYDRDSEELSREREGYSLSIRSDARSGGMQILKKLSLLNQVLESSAPGKQVFTVWDKEWNILMQVPPTIPDGLPVRAARIARWKLRTTLAQAAAPFCTINWSTTCSAATLLDNGKMQVHLSDERTDDCDNFIAADGASSKLRELLRPDEQLQYAGVVAISGLTRFENSSIPSPLDNAFGSVVGGNGTSLFLSAVDASSVVWSVSYISKEPRARSVRTLSTSEAEKLLAEALDIGTVFKEPFQSLVNGTDLAIITVLSAMDKLPFPHEGGEPIIFIGDSNHAVTPFAGNGANMALMDGWDLAEQLCGSESLEEALKRYDSLSMPRSRGALEDSHEDIRMIHAVQ